ncbi:MAG: Fe-S cluster assembly sulfur transfer protein SufU [Chloroflexia bacterium]
MEDFYREYILDHYRNPRNHGVIEAPDYTYEDSNPLCGDVLRLDLSVDEQNMIEDVKFSGRGCAISQASASMLTELIEGKSLDEVKQINKEDLLETLGITISPARLKCALLSLKVLKGGVYLGAQEDEDDL